MFCLFRKHSSNKDLASHAPLLQGDSVLVRELQCPLIFLVFILNEACKRGLKNNKE